MPIVARPQTFPKNFAWGFAAAAPQIEGAATADGKGPSVWDAFARRPGAVANGDTLDVACDHYNRYKKDFALMASLGAKHYRLSLAWPRLYPDGGTALNRKGVGFYHRLIDACLDAGLRPWVTFFHWDMPQALEDQFGGWRDRRIVDSFARYADTVVQSYGDRVKDWITLNEILCFTTLGYGVGVKAPGLKLDQGVVNQTYHHALLCHGEAVRAVREHGGRGARVGLTDNCTVSVPLTETADDIAAARLAFQSDNWRVLDPIYTGAYPEKFLRKAGRHAPKFTDSDLERISQPTDFLGLNIYSGHFVRAPRRKNKEGFERLPFPPNYPRADSPWLMHVPQALYWGPRHVTEIYGVKSIVITENGCGYDDQPPANGEVLDLHRRDLVRNYLGELHRAIRDGVPVRGYFLWSFMDNYEWEDGYQRRFGVVYCDFKTQKRTPKASALWYREVIRANALV